MAKQDPKPVADKTDKKSSIPTKPITKRQMNAIAVEKTMTAAAKEKAVKAPAAKPKPVAKAAEKEDSGKWLDTQNHEILVGGIVELIREQGNNKTNFKTKLLAELDLRGLDAKNKDILMETVDELLDPNNSKSLDQKADLLGEALTKAMMTSPEVQAEIAADVEAAAKKSSKPAAPKKSLGTDVPAIGGSRAMSKIRRVMEEAEKTTLGEGAKLKSIPPWEDLPDTPAAIEAPAPVKKAVVAPKEASLSEVLAQAKTTPAGVSHGTSSASFADIINNAAVAASPLANLGFTIPGAAPSKK